MVSLEDSVTARFETGGNRFEILIDPEAAQQYKEGEEIDWEIELEYGRETFVATGEEVQFLENIKTGEKCVIIQITRDI